MSKQNVVIVILAVLLLWAWAALARVENQRYALLVGMCRAPVTQLVDSTCLATVKTRNNALWNLFYGLTGN